MNAKAIVTRGVAAAALISGVVASMNPLQATASTGPVIHLTYWNMWSGIWLKTIQKMVNDFNQTHPNIQVTMLSVPATSEGQSEQKLLTAIAAGDPPDVFTEWWPYVASFAQQGALVNLDQFMVGQYAGLKNGWFYPTVTKWGSYQGKMYAMPWTMNSWALYYNKTLFKEAGLNPNNPPKTIAQLDADQAKLWKFGSGGSVKQIGYYPNNFDFWSAAYHINIIKNGKYNMLDPNAVKLMNWIASYKKYPYSQVNAFLTGLNGGNGGSDPFILGKEAFINDGMWEMPALQQYNPKLQYGIIPMPAPTGGAYGASWINGNYNEIPKGSKHPQQAFEFIAWLSGYHNVKWAAENFPVGGWVPNSPKITAQPAYQNFLKANPLRKVFINIMSNPNNQITPATAVDALYENTMNNDVTAVLEGKETATQALLHVQNAVNKALQKTQ